MLLIDYLEDAAQKIREHKEKLQKLDKQYRHYYDRDTRREMILIRKEIKRIKGDLKYELLLNLEEFRYLHKYFPELLQTFMEDEHIGPALRKKAWLLDFKPTQGKEAAMKLAQLKHMRIQLREARKTLGGWVGTVEARAFVATYPALKGHMTEDLEKDEAIELTRKIDKELLKEGWLLLISDALVKIPIMKFMNRIQMLRGNELLAMGEFQRSKGKGTVKETEAQRNLEKISRRKEHYENVLKQILLSNPSYLRLLKRKDSWISRERKTAFQKFIRTIVPHKVKERAWLNEMNKKLEE